MLVIVASVMGVVAAFAYSSLPGYYGHLLFPDYQKQSSVDPGTVLGSLVATNLALGHHGSWTNFDLVSPRSSC